MKAERIPRLEHIVSYGEEVRPPKLDKSNGRYWILANFIAGNLVVPENYIKRERKRIGQSWTHSEEATMQDHIGFTHKYGKSQFGDNASLSDGVGLMGRRHALIFPKSLDKPVIEGSNINIHEIVPDPNAQVEDVGVERTDLSLFWSEVRKILPDREFEAFCNVYQKELTVSEFAELKGVSSRTIQVRIKEAKKIINAHPEIKKILY